LQFDKLTEPWNCTFVFVTNELGSGTHPHDHTSRKFVDAQGWFAQYVAKRSKYVIHMVCGCPNVLKGPPSSPGPFSPALSLAVSNSGGLASPTIDEANRADMLNHYLSKRDINMDPSGYFKLKIDTEQKEIQASYHSCIINEKGEFFDLDGNRLHCHGKSPVPIKVWSARTAKELTMQVLEQWEMAAKVVTVGHASYIGREAQKAETALYSGKAYRQD
jgi:hypothetical protein